MRWIKTAAVGIALGLVAAGALRATQGPSARPVMVPPRVPPQMVAETKGDQIERPVIHLAATPLTGDVWYPWFFKPAEDEEAGPSPPPKPVKAASICTRYGLTQIWYGRRWRCARGRR